MFKVGDKVVCVRGSEFADLHDPQEGKEYTVLRVSKTGEVEIKAGQGCWYADRFKLAEPAVLAFAVGCAILRTGKSHVNVKTGNEYIVETLYKDAMGGVEKVKLVGINAIYNVGGFQVVREPPKEVEWKPEVGKMALIVGPNYYKNTDCIGNVGKITEKLGHRGELLYYINEWFPVSSITEATPEAIANAKAIAKERKEKAEAEAAALAARRLEKTKNYHPCPNLQKELRESEEDATGLVSYAFEYRNGDKHFTPNSACHANLAYMRGEAVGQFIYGLHWDLRFVKDKTKHHRAYYDYLLNHSPWAHCYLVKDVDDAMENDVQMNLNVHVNIFAGACVAMRSGTEKDGRAQSFKVFSDKGFLPNTCWLMANAVKWHANKPMLITMNGGHDVIDGYRDMDDLVKFFKQGYHLDNSPATEPIATHSQGFIIAGAIARRNEAKSFNIWIKENVKSTQVGEGWGATQVVTAESVFAAAELLDNLLKA